MHNSSFQSPSRLPPARPRCNSSSAETVQQYKRVLGGVTAIQNPACQGLGTATVAFAYARHRIMQQQ